MCFSEHTPIFFIISIHTNTKLEFVNITVADISTVHKQWNVNTVTYRSWEHGTFVLSLKWNYSLYVKCPPMIYKQCATMLDAIFVEHAPAHAMTE